MVVPAAVHACQLQHCVLAEQGTHSQAHATPSPAGGVQALPSTDALNCADCRVAASKAKFADSVVVP